MKTRRKTNMNMNMKMLPVDLRVGIVFGGVLDPIIENGQTIDVK